MLYEVITSAAGASGLAISVALLLRPNLAPLVIVPFSMFLIALVLSRGSQRAWGRGAAFVVGLVPGVTANALISYNFV